MTIFGRERANARDALIKSPASANGVDDSGFRARRTACAATASTMLLLAACSPVTTHIDPPATAAGAGGSHASKSNDGLVYYLPLKAVIVTLTVKNSATPKRTVTIETSGAFADHSHKFVAQYNVNQVGTNALDVKVDENGLLNGETTSTLTPHVSDVLTGLATDLGELAGMRGGVRGPLAKAKPTACDADGTYSWLVNPATDKAGSAEAEAFQQSQDQMKACGLDFEPTLLYHDPAKRGDSGRIHDGAADGFFYRQAVPYLLTVTDLQPPSLRQSKLVTIPTHDSPVEFLPAQRSLFAANTLKISFAYGTPTSYNQSADSEWLGVVSLPAAVIKAYLTAVTDAFKDRSTLNSQVATYLQGVNTLATQQAKTQLCLAALKTKDDAQIQTACQ